MPPRRMLPPLLLLLAAIVAPSLARAQAASGAQSTFIDPSIRAAGMGGAGAAVFWGESPDDWANPALLSLRHGIRYEWGKTQLVPDLADDVYYQSKRITAGAWGAGLAFVGRPFDGLGLDKLDYGLSVATDINGDPIGTFRSFEEIRSIGVGISILEFLENLVRATGGKAPQLSRYGDVSIGHSWKRVVVDLAPADFTQSGVAARGEAETADRGLLLRVTPYDSDRSGRSEEARRGSRVDLGFAWSARNYDESTIAYTDPTQADPIDEDRRLGASARWSLFLPHTSGILSGGSWLLGTINPVVSLGATWEQGRYSWRGRQDGSSIKRWGVELTWLDLISTRVGHVDDPTGTIQAATWGLGAGIHYRDIVGARYDYASVPQSRYLERLKRHDFSVFVNPVPLWNLLRERSGG